MLFNSETRVQDCRSLGQVQVEEEELAGPGQDDGECQSPEHVARKCAREYIFLLDGPIKLFYAI